MAINDNLSQTNDLLKAILKELKDMNTNQAKEIDRDEYDAMPQEEKNKYKVAKKKGQEKVILKWKE